MQNTLHLTSKVIIKAKVVILITIIKQLEPITKENRYCRDEENFVEIDINQLRQKIDEIQQKLEQFTQKDTNKIIIVDNDQID
ncbi:unnamed protein product [Rotaria sordida]|uniref:Uncharacterized protein n=1 Tax=Rotaria sordida TaxID=392033 RepID=A0A815TEV0_9BILA|nr:unnamed protein product [Rotaria sordida]CAF1655183.1 unnamed protein product [Rotaria sordida]